jgi:hypothetical protein
MPSLRRLVPTFVALVFLGKGSLTKAVSLCYALRAWIRRKGRKQCRFKKPQAIHVVGIVTMAAGHLFGA